MERMDGIGWDRIGMVIIGRRLSESTFGVINRTVLDE